jgi:hypothetical protein
MGETAPVMPMYTRGQLFLAVFVALAIGFVLGIVYPATVVAL